MSIYLYGTSTPVHLYFEPIYDSPPNLHGNISWTIKRGSYVTFPYILGQGRFLNVKYL